MYDDVADEYAEQFVDELAGKPFDRALLDWVAARCAGGVLADLGCGPGQVGRYVGATVGLDLSLPMLRHARFPLRVQGDLRALPFASGSLAGIVAFYCYIHLESLDVAFADARRVSATGASSWCRSPASTSRPPPNPPGRPSPATSPHVRG